MNRYSSERNASGLTRASGPWSANSGAGGGESGVAPTPPPADFSIVIDTSLNMVRIMMRGFFLEADVNAFHELLEIKMRELTSAPNHHLTLCDVSGMKIQTQDIVAAFARLVGKPENQSRKLAFVTGSSLARMQTKRLTDREGVQFFSDVAAAEDWLLA